MCNLIKSNLQDLVSGNFQIYSQSLLDGESFYPKRSPADGSIDWRDDIYNIERLIRAVTKPFDGAFSIIKGEKIIIERASIFYTDIENHPFKNTKFGKMLKHF